MRPPSPEADETYQMPRNGQNRADRGFGVADEKGAHAGLGPLIDVPVVPWRGVPVDNPLLGSPDPPGVELVSSQLTRLHAIPTLGNT